MFSEPSESSMCLDPQLAPNNKELDPHYASYILFSFPEFTKFVRCVITMHSASIKSGYTRWKTIENFQVDNL